MSYTIQDFISRAVLGRGVSVSASIPTVDVMIDGQSFTVVSTPSIDIGQYFSARQVLESYPLRANIIGGIVIASDGVTSLSII